MDHSENDLAELLSKQLPRTKTYK